MDKTERETHDFMNVESFSQLPFIRPAPSAIKEKGIRLFGIEFGSGNSTTVAATTTDESESAETTTNNNAFELDSSNNKDNNNSAENNGGESSRRFECHYCCRNFPTSQALGGHQNAHKRERQHAKRAHLQSAMVHGTFSDPHQVYGLMNYRFNSTPTSPMAYTSWNNTSNSLNAITSSTSTLGGGGGGGGRFYHGTSSYSHHHQQQQQPINGSPLAIWRIPSGTSSNPSFNHERSLLQQSLPLFSGEEMNMRASSQVGGSSSQNRFVYDSSKRSVHDHVSLDLHL